MPAEPMKIRTIVAAALVVLAGGSQATTTQLASSPMSSASSVEIATNILFVLDDSGSMAWDYLPDWAGLTSELARSRNPAFNGIAYDPTVRYIPPKYFTVDGSPDSSTYPSQTSAQTTSWTAVRDDGYGVQSTATSNLIGNAYYFTASAGEYCSNRSLKSCTAASAASESYPVAARLRWCSSAADAVAATPTSGACQATQIEPTETNTGFNYGRMPSPRTSTLTISGTSSTSLQNITVDGQSILATAVAATSSPTTMAQAIENSINACSFGLTGMCQVAGYRALASGSTVTIASPAANTAPAVIFKTGSMSITASNFGRPASNLAPGENLLTIIYAGRSTYPKTEKRSDCAGATTCSYEEEMTNYANWWAYYRTRMQAMKTATSLSFEPTDQRQRIGYMSINNNTGSDFQNIDAFSAAQKKAWYDKLFAAVPNLNTPLRVALANAGRLYTGRLNGTTFNGVTVVDPVQYYCQQNVTILSTDGYWNEGAGFMWNGSTPVGDQDGPGLEVRPQLDGGGPQDQRVTSQTTRTQTPTQATQAQRTTEQLQSQTVPLQIRTFDQPEARTSLLQARDAQVQAQTSQLQISTYTQAQTRTLVSQESTRLLYTRSGPLQQRTSTLQTRNLDVLQTRTSTLQSQTGQLQSRSRQLQQRVTQVQRKTSSNGGTSYGAWGDVASCTPVTSGTNRVACQVLAQTAWSNVSSCTAVNGGTTVNNAGTDSETTTYTTDSQCQYTSPSGWTNVSTCTPLAQSAGPTSYTVGTAIECQTTWPNSYVNAASCTPSETVRCQYTGWSGWSNAASCTAQAQTTSPYVATARECQMNWGSWTNTASTCTASATVGCQYAGWTSWSNSDTCTALPRSGGPSYTVTQAVECQVNWGSWSTATACTIVSTGANRTHCQYDSGGWSSWQTVASCTPQAQTGPTNFVGPARQCQSVWTAWSNTGSCTANASTQCQFTWTPFTNTGSCTAASGATQCQYSPWTGWTDVSSCTPATQSSGPNYTVGTATNCQTTWSDSWADASSCTVSPTRECRYYHPRDGRNADGWSGWSDVSSCTPLPRSESSPYTVGVATECRTGWSPWSSTDSCTEVTGVTRCQEGSPGPWVNASECTDTQTANCQTVPVIGDWSDVGSCTEGTVGGLTTYCRNVIPPPSSEFVLPADCVEGTSESGVITTCTTTTTGPTNVPECRPQTASADNQYLEVSCPTVSLGPTDDTLADVAEYYWKTDLRDDSIPDSCTGGPIVVGGITRSENVCTNDATNPRQYMSTYTLGLGASGLMQYDKENSYLTATSGDFFSIKEGLTADPSAGICPWQRNGVCNWPKPESNKQTNIDDLWHAAVNGRGIYFSASDPATVAAGISDALSDVAVKAGALAAVSVVNPNLVTGANGVFEVSFRVGEWSGDVVKRTIDGTTGALSALPEEGAAHPSPGWSAKERLDTKVTTNGYTSRRIFTYNPGGESASGASDRLKFFTWANLTLSEKDYFATAALAGTLSQFCSTGTICLSESTQAAASGEPLVNFLRGDRTNQGPLVATSAYYRQRAHLLGDIVGSEPTYVQASPWNYADYQYGTFKATNRTRTAMIYVGANDGMLHAINATSGDEEWAYIPSMVMSRLPKLADKNYNVEGAHQFTVDGTPVMGDICVSACATPVSGTATAVWKTILVGGLNNGGRGYYALDITDPAAPKALWEFTNDNLGYSYGNPVITKLKDGTWVVAVASGYNNVGPGDGGGHLFLLNANTGALIRVISTGAGDSSTPSGLARIAAWANFPDNNNTAQRIYGGDQFGNLWRFDINGDIPTTASPVVYDAQRLAALKDADGVAQPITAKPELGKVGGHPVVFVASGQLLGPNDLSTNQRHSMYAIKDRLTDTDYGSPRPLTPAQTTPAPGSFVAQTLTAGSCPAGNAFCAEGAAIVNGSNNAVDFNTHDGWYVDFPVLGERVNTDLRLQLGTLAFNTNTPTVGACQPVGVSFGYYLDYRSGAAIEGTDGMAGSRLGDYLSAAPSIIRLVDGTIRALIRTDAPSTISAPIPTAPTPFDTRRVSWRELVTEQ